MINKIIILILLLLLFYLFLNKEFFDIYEKKINLKGRNNYYTGLSASNSFLLEENCLKNLKKNYKCICKEKKRNHFPKIVSITDDKNNSKIKTITMTHQGKSINKLHKRDIDKIKSKNVNIKEQIQCILKNLIDSKIIHRDMHKSGKNLTINEDGDLSLIDFNIAYSDNFKPKSSNTKKYIETSRNENGDLNKNSYIRFFNILESKGLI